MNERRQPPSPPPRFESYRPAEERPNAPPPGPRPGYPPQATRPGMPPQQRRRPPSPQQDEWSPVLKWSLYGGLGLVVLAVLAVGLLFMALPTDAVRERVIAEVKERTGRDLVISGPATFSIYPSVGVALNGVSLSGRPDAEAGKPLATMEAIDVSVRLWPLLRQEVRVSRLVLRKPEFNLEVDRQGRTSWDLKKPGSSPTLPPAALPPSAAAPGELPAEPGAVAQAPPREPAGARSKLQELEFGDVRIEDGTLRYADARSGAVREVSAVNATLSLPSIAYPLRATGSLAWKGKSVDFDAELTSVKAVIEDRPARLALALKSDVAETGFDGTVSFVGAFDAEGTFTAKSASARDLARWLGVELGSPEGFGPLDAKGLVRVGGTSVSFTSAELALDGETARGQMTIDTAGARPYVKANIKLSALDLNRYKGALSHAVPTPSAPAPAQSPAAQIPAGESPAGGTSASPSSIDDLLAREPAPQGPQVKGYVERDGWSEEPFDLSGLGLIDADAKLSVGRFVIREIKAAQSEFTVALKAGVVKATFDDVRLYEGRGHGFVTLDASKPSVANVGGNVTLEGISALPLLKDAAEIDWLSGTGKLAFALAGRGGSERQLIDTLNGRAEFTFTDGAIVGVNIPQMVRGFGRPSGEASGVEKTDFSELYSSWGVTDGVAENRDLRLTSPLLRVTGSGNVMLPARQIDYMLRPRLVASLSGQGGDQNASGIEIPVHVHGSLEKPKFTPDVGAAFKDPDKAKETIKEIGKQFKGKSAGEIVKDLFGSGDEPPGDEKPAKKLLDQFLNKE